jgi:hypothetical protein
MASQLPYDAAVVLVSQLRHKVEYCQENDVGTPKGNHFRPGVVPFEPTTAKVVTEARTESSSTKGTTDVGVRARNDVVSSPAPDLQAFHLRHGAIGT